MLTEPVAARFGRGQARADHHRPCYDRRTRGGHAERFCSQRRHLSQDGVPPRSIRPRPSRLSEPDQASTGAGRNDRNGAGWTRKPNFIRDTWSTEILDELKPQKGDTVLYKTRYSGFYGTDLDSILKTRGIKSLVVTGATTCVCVDSTIRDAMFRDYTCVLLEDCTGEPIGSESTRSNHEAALLTIQTLFGWVSTSAELIEALRKA